MGALCIESNHKPGWGGSVSHSVSVKMCTFEKHEWTKGDVLVARVQIEMLPSEQISSSSRLTRFSLGSRVEGST